NDLTEGSFSFRLTAFDDMGAQSSDNVVVNVNPENTNQPPVADAGPDRVISLPTNTIELRGLGTDQDGTISSYRWSKTSGPAADINDFNVPTLLISNMDEGIYEFRLRVTDNENALGDDFVIVTVLSEETNTPPTVNAGTDIVIQLPQNSVELIGIVSDDDEIQSIEWTQTSGSNDVVLAGENSETLSVSNLSVGSYGFRLTATDNEEASSSDDVSISVIAAVDTTNIPPAVNAGEDQLIQLPSSSTTLAASGEDENDIISTFEWAQMSGPNNAVIENDTASITAISNLTIGNYIFRVVVTDGFGATSSDDVRVTVIREGQDNINISNMFSPNGDGIDDFWIVDNNQRIDNCRVILFNRSGDEVYRSNGYQNDWDGTSSDGRPLPTDAYFYVIRCTGDTNNLTGSVTIIR
ncbi:MAG: gliding motility-associated C-terminal domain-containing protein, partial [Bacteroidota bacterium]